MSEHFRPAALQEMHKLGLFGHLQLRAPNLAPHKTEIHHELRPDMQQNPCTRRTGPPDNCVNPMPHSSCMRRTPDNLLPTVVGKSRLPLLAKLRPRSFGLLSPKHCSHPCMNSDL